MAGDELPSVLNLGTDIAEAEAPELLPAGQYVCEIKKAEPKRSAAGNGYVAVQLYISPEEYPADYDVAESPDGVIVTYQRVPWPDAGDKRGIYRLRKFMENIGAPFEGATVDCDKWVGLKAVVNVKHGSYEGEPRLEAASVSKDV